ncbi:MAG: DUF1653 domain-containing protein [Lachnospiraceae bacterium]|nr:DUF1653 domain-containing protein [Lachnospiraceae bacterium]
MRELPKPFEVYRHFKGNTYQIITLARDSESDRQLVVYQALYGDYTVYVRELEDFLSLTDRSKYPKAEQEYRFERITPGASEVAAPAEPAAPAQKTAPAEPAAPAQKTAPVEPAAPTGEDALDPAVLEYLEAETYEQRLNILASVKHRITDDMINTMALASDVEVEPGAVESRYQSLKNCLLMKDRFERVRLR